MSWQRIRGHDALVAAFAHARRRNRLGHAYLFCGQPGVGKRLFATELAKAMLCEDPPEGRWDSCDRCPACHQVEAKTHPDFHVAARPEDVLDLPIAVVRELCGSFALKPARGKGKVAILDDADDLNEAAANCFLKTLEEPPPGAILIMIGTEVDRQLPTLVSRCQIVRFPPLPEALVVELLRTQEIADSAQAPRLARLCGGSLGQARDLADPALWEFRRTLVAGLVQPHPDSVTLGRGLTHFVEEAGKESGNQRRRASLVLRLLIEFLSDVLALTVGASAKIGDFGDLGEMEALARRCDPDKVIELLERCLESDVHIDRRVQLVLILEGLLDALGSKVPSR